MGLDLGTGICPRSCNESQVGHFGQRIRGGGGALLNVLTIYKGQRGLTTTYHQIFLAPFIVTATTTTIKNCRTTTTPSWHL